jgi:multidrug efflux pump subunit AcrB
MGRLEKFFTSIILKVRDGFFAPMARFALDNPVFALAVPISLFLVTMGGFAGGLIKTTFFPNIEQESISVNLEMPIGTVEERTLSILSGIEANVVELNSNYRENDPEGKDLVMNVVKTVGPQTNQGKLDIYLLNAEERTQPAFEVAGDLRNLVGPIYEAKTLVFGQLSPFGKPVSIALTSPNLDELKNATEWLKDQLRERPALRDVTDNEQIGKKEIDITLKDGAHQLGLSLGEVIRQVRQGFFGQEIQSLQRGVDEVKVWVRYGKEQRKSVAQLEEMRIRTAQGLSIPLREIANFEQREGIVSINHLDGQRQVLVEADVANLKVSVTDEVAEINQAIMPELLSRFPTIRYSFEGQSRTAAKSGASAATAGQVLLLLMVSVAIFNFRSFVQGITIFLLAPFAIIGVGWGHVLHGMPISIFSMLGIIALTGVLINDSLVYVNTLNGYLKEGQKLKESLYKTSIVRFRPIVLTSMTTIAGLAPLMTETSFQAQFLIPMAVSLTYGLVMTTVLTLLLLPTLLLLSNAVRRRVHWIWHGVMPTPEEVEPAQRELHNFD